MFPVKVGNESPVKKEVTDGGEQAAVGAGVIAKNRGVRVNRKNGADDLRKKEKKKRPVKKSMAEKKLAVKNHSA